jgi:hypothetical protein
MSYVKSNHRHYPGYMAIKMKKFTLTILFVLLASPAWATTYFLAPASGGGNDSNNGTSASTPWLSPNHPVNCGDTITATPSATYSASNFGAGKWGTVTCPAGNNVAWLECAAFDACKISSSSSNGMQISSSFWGVQGWEITTSSNANITCFLVTPPSSSVIHHVVFANDIANGCENGGFSANYNGSTGADYIAYVGDIAYNAASGGSDCASGFNIVNPSNKDTAAGTHSYIAGNFSWSNVDPSGCTDGEGIILDSIFTNGYTQQIYVSNNLIIGNGGRGIEVLKNNNASAAIIYIEQNTTWNNEIDNTETPGGSFSEIFLFQDKNTTVSGNLAVTDHANGPQGFAYYAYLCNSCDSSDSASGNDAFSAAGNNYLAEFGSGFSFGTNATTNPSFSSASVPGAPSCGSATSVPNCMATMIADFTPTTAAAKAYGYQIPSTSPTSDPLFPQWLCNINLPPGLVTMGCGSASAPPAPAPPTNISISVQ